MRQPSYFARDISLPVLLAIVTPSLLPNSQVGPTTTQLWRLSSSIACRLSLETDTVRLDDSTLVHSTRTELWTGLNWPSYTTRSFVTRVSVTIDLFRNSQLNTLYSTVKSRTEMTIISQNRKVSRQFTDRYLQCKQGTVLNITGSYTYKQLIQQLVRSLAIRV